MAKKEKDLDLLTNPDALADRFSRSEDFLKSNKNILIGGLTAIVIAVGAFLFFKNQKANKNLEAQKALYPAEYYFNLDSLNLVLEGNDDFAGVLELASTYSGTEAGELANYYAGVVYMKQGEYEKAIQHLKKFDASDLIVQARAYSLIGDAYSQLEKYADAKSYYVKAVNHNPNKQFTPKYLLKLAINYEMLKDYAAASVEYDKIIKKYPNAPEVNKAKKLKARASGLSKG